MKLCWMKFDEWTIDAIIGHTSANRSQGLRDYTHNEQIEI